MLTLIFLGIIINLLPLYKLSYFVFCSFNYFCVFLCTRANFVIGLCAVLHVNKHELNWIIMTTEQAGVAVTLWTSIQELLGSNLGQDIEYTDWGLSFH
jgi:hypothetical protein